MRYPRHPRFLSNTYYIQVFAKFFSSFSATRNSSLLETHFAPLLKDSRDDTSTPSVRVTDLCLLRARLRVLFVVVQSERVFIRGGGFFVFVYVFFQSRGNEFVFKSAPASALEAIQIRFDEDGRRGRRFEREKQY